MPGRYLSHLCVLHLAGTRSASGLAAVPSLRRGRRRPSQKGATARRPQAEGVATRWTAREYASGRLLPASLICSGLGPARPAPIKIERAPGQARDQRGFTLIELLVVVIILGLLAALVGPRFFGQLGKSKQATARVQIELLGGALDQFRLDIGRYPTTQEGLQALQANPGNVGGWDGPYLKKDVPPDPWGNPYQYKSPGDHGEYDIWSYGADKTAGGEGEAADVTSWGREGRQG